MEERQDPDLLLKKIQKEEESKKRGHLKIFFGYAAGVGKTYAMLKAAHNAQRKNIDIVAGYVEPHPRPETSKLLSGLEVIPPLELSYNGIILKEFNLDSAIKRHPQIILVDELAHTNAQGCRHAKRYQDVEELLNAGIDVYTTVNVQHIESLNDMVSSITEIIVRERIPDSVFDDADQVELIDLEPKDLLDRLTAGKIYNETQARRATESFFTLENLTSLREIALRRCADRVNKLTEESREKNQSAIPTDEHILVCLSSSPSNPKIIRTAARMAKAFNGVFTALYVETSDFASMSDDNKKRLQANTELAQQLGATIETVYGNDISFQISEFARLSGVSKIVIGRSASVSKGLFRKPSLTEQLIANAPNLDIHIIPDTINSKKPLGFYNPYKTGKNKNKPKTSGYNNKYSRGYNRNGEEKSAFSITDILKTIIILAAATVVSYIFHYFHFYEANIILLYVLAVLLISVVTINRYYSLVSAIVSVLIFNFLFTDPIFTLKAYGKGYPVTFIVMFFSALITGSLAEKLKSSAKQSALAAYRTKVLFDLNQLMQKADSKKEIVSATAIQLNKLLNKNIIVYLSDTEHAYELGRAILFPCEGDFISPDCISSNEKAVALWTYRNKKQAGATTQTLSNAKCRYLSIRVNDNVYGVIGIVINEEPIDTFENSILLSMLGECALALENENNAREKEETALLAKNEQLKANLLRAISHDLRTPLTSISGNASNLLSNGNSFDDNTKKQLYSDIYDDSMWLINLVENLLAVTRLQEGQLNLNITADLISDVTEEALKHINRKSVDHIIKVNHEDDLLLAKMDARLIIQVIINIVDNAIKYTPNGSTIEINTKKSKDNSFVEVSISDNGEGISDSNKEHIFDMFFCGSNKIADSHRSLGLGLSLCKSIITAHGGTIEVKDNKPKGTVFTFTLKAGEAQLYE